MAETTVCITQQQKKPLKVLKWKVSEGNIVSIGSVLLLYDFEPHEKPEQRKLKSTQAGTVHQIIAQEGAIVKPGEVLFELTKCSHPTIMNDLCAECGADLRKDDLVSTASVPMVHAIPDLKVSEELAQKLGRADRDRLIKERKLVLLVDLDQTLIHTTNDNIPANLKDVYHFQLYGPNSPWYHTRLRPGTHDFLESIWPYFELHICTFGARNYAHMIASFLDEDGRLFSHRILSRDECFDPTSKKANLKALFPCGDNMVCIIDDREDVWNHATNLIHVKPYHFFQHTGDINAPPGLDKHEDDNKKGVDLTKVKSNNEKDVVNGAKNVSINANMEDSDSQNEELTEKILVNGENEVLTENEIDNTIKESSDDKITEEKMDTDTDIESQLQKSVDVADKIKQADKENLTESKENLTESKENLTENKENLIESKQNLTESNNSLREEPKGKSNDAKTIDKTATNCESEDIDIGSEPPQLVEENKNELGEPQKSAEGKELVEGNVNESSVPEKPVEEIKETSESPKLVEEMKATSESAKLVEEKQEAVPKDDGQIDIEDPDDYLLYLEEILKRIHDQFYDEFDRMETGEVPDLKLVIPAVRAQVLKGTKLVFSGLVPTHIRLEESKAYQVARSLGAKVTQDLEDDTTHLVAVRPGTAKVNAGRRRKSLKIVTPDWLWCCAERWEHVDEQLYILSSKGSKNRHPPPHCSSPEHVTNYPTRENLALRKRTPSGRFMDTINPLMSFSSADIASMDKEVEDILDNDSDSSSDQEEPKVDEEVVKSVMSLNEEEDAEVEKEAELEANMEKEAQESSSSSAESLSGEHRGHRRLLWARGRKRRRSEDKDDDYDDDLNKCDSDSDVPSVKFRRGNTEVDSDLDVEPSSQESVGSIDPPSSVDDKEWNAMGEALEREFLSND